jgi:hypothetical protein
MNFAGPMEVPSSDLKMTSLKNMNVAKKFFQLLARASPPLLEFFKASTERAPSVGSEVANGEGWPCFVPPGWLENFRRANRRTSQGRGTNTE